MATNNTSSGRRKRWVMVGLLCIVIAVTLFPRVKTVAELTQRREALLEEKALLEKENQRLQQELKQVDSPENIEKLAREQLGMVKPGEQRLVPVLSE